MFDKPPFASNEQRRINILFHRVYKKFGQKPTFQTKPAALHLFKKILVEINVSTKTKNLCYS